MYVLLQHAFNILVMKEAKLDFHSLQMGNLMDVEVEWFTSHHPGGAGLTLLPVFPFTQTMFFTHDRSTAISCFYFLAPEFLIT